MPLYRNNKGKEPKEVWYEKDKKIRPVLYYRGDWLRSNRNDMARSYPLVNDDRWGTLLRTVLRRGKADAPQKCTAEGGCLRHRSNGY